jgi:hypothetical protein
MDNEASFRHGSLPMVREQSRINGIDALRFLTGIVKHVFYCLVNGLWRLLAESVAAASLRSNPPHRVPGVASRDVRATILVPLRDNAGRLQPLHLLTTLIREVVAAAGGYTALAGSGAWLSEDGRLFVEPHIAFIVDNFDRVVLHRAAARWCRSLRQERLAILIDDLSKPWFVSANDEAA